MYLGHILALCLYRGRFLFTRVRFSWLTCLWRILSYASTVVGFPSPEKSFPTHTPQHILPCASTMMDFSSRELDFSDSYALSTFCLMPLPWWISHHASWVSWLTCLRHILTLGFYRDRFFFTWVEFSSRTSTYFTLYLCHGRRFCLNQRPCKQFKYAMTASMWQLPW